MVGKKGMDNSWVSSVSRIVREAIPIGLTASALGRVLREDLAR